MMIFIGRGEWDKPAKKFVEGDSSRSTTSDILQKKLDHGIMYESVSLEKYKVCMQKSLQGIYMALQNASVLRSINIQIYLMLLPAMIQISSCYMSRMANCIYEKHTVLIINATRE